MAFVQGTLHLWKIQENLLPGRCYYSRVYVYLPLICVYFKSDIVIKYEVWDILGVKLTSHIF